METNLLTHQIVTLIQEFALDEYQGPEGFLKIATLVDSGLQVLGSNASRASTHDYRKLYHEGWKPLVKSFCPTGHLDLVDEKFRRLVF